MSGSGVIGEAALGKAQSGHKMGTPTAKDSLLAMGPHQKKGKKRERQSNGRLCRRLLCTVLTLRSHWQEAEPQQPKQPKQLFQKQHTTKKK